MTCAAVSDQSPTITQRLLRALGADFYREGRPFSACRTKDERIGYELAQAEAKATDNDE